VSKLQNFDVKALSIFQPQSAEKVNGILYMTSYFGKGCKIQYAIGKHNKRQKRPLVYGITLSKFDIVTNKTYKFHCGLICNDERFDEYEIDLGIDNIHECEFPFQVEFITHIRLSMILFKLFYQQMSGAIQIDFDDVFEGILTDNDWTETLKEVLHIFDSVWTETDNKLRSI
jgi:hypothetical protein